MYIYIYIELSTTRLYSMVVTRPAPNASATDSYLSMSGYCSG